MDMLSRIGRHALTARLSALHDGHLILADRVTVTHWGDAAQPAITLTVIDPRFYSAVAFGGSVGAGEAYGDGVWETDDLTGLIRLLLRNRDVLDGMETGLARLAVPARRLFHALNRNTKQRSRQNIAAHYDLSNEFFATFLDSTMTYSCALFDRPGMSLEEASESKYARMAAALDVRPYDRIIEIGTGWGGFAIHAAKHYGCHVTTTTISEAQHRMASQRVAEAGLTDRITILQQDYRDLQGSYDGLVSIEMVEAVGHDHYDAFFTQCAKLLKPHGRAAIQAITIRDDRYEAARREVDFIKRHIFPGSCIPSRAVLTDAAARNGLHLARADEMGLHYAETLRRWHDAMILNRDAILALGFDEHFLRVWEFYFCYCEGGFLETAIGTAQMVFTPATSALARPVDVADIPSSPHTGVAA